MENPQEYKEDPKEVESALEEADKLGLREALIKERDLAKKFLAKLLK